MRNKLLIALMFVLLIGSVTAEDYPAPVSSPEFNNVISQIQSALNQKDIKDIKLSGFGDAGKASFDAEKGVIRYGEKYFDIDILKNLKGAEVTFEGAGGLVIDYRGDVAKVDKVLAIINGDNFNGATFRLNIQKSGVLSRKGIQLKNNLREFTDSPLGALRVSAQTAAGAVPVVGQVVDVNAWSGVFNADRLKSEGIIAVKPEANAVFDVGGQKFAVSGDKDILIIPSGLGEEGKLSEKDNFMTFSMTGDKVNGYKISGMGFDVLVPDQSDKTGKMYSRFKLGGENARGEIAFSSSSSLPSGEKVNLDDLRQNHATIAGKAKAKIGSLFVGTGEGVDFSGLEMPDLGVTEGLGGAAKFVNGKVNFGELINPMKWNVGGIFHSDEAVQEVSDDSPGAGIVPLERPAEVSEFITRTLPRDEGSSTSSPPSQSSSSVTQVTTPGEGTSLLSGNKFFENNPDIKTPRDLINKAYSNAGYQEGNGAHRQADLKSSFWYNKAATELKKMNTGYTMGQLVQMRNSEQKFPSALSQAAEPSELPATPLKVVVPVAIQPAPKRIIPRAGSSFVPVSPEEQGREALEPQRVEFARATSLDSLQGNYDSQMAAIEKSLEGLNPGLKTTSERAKLFGQKIPGVEVSENGLVVSGGGSTYRYNSPSGGGPHTASGIDHPILMERGVPYVAVNTRFFKPGDVLEITNSANGRTAMAIGLDAYGSSFDKFPGRIMDFPTTSITTKELGISNPSLPKIKVRRIGRISSDGKIIRY